MAITYNGYELPNVQNVTKPVAAITRRSETLGRDGSFSMRNLLAPKRIVVKGIMPATGFENQNEVWDEFLTNLPVGDTYPLIIESGRRYMAQVDASFDSISPQWFAVEYEVEFFIPSGCSESATLQGEDLTNTGGSVSVVGNHYALPKFTLEVTDDGTNGTFSITNSTTGESITIAPSGAGVFVIDSDTETITKDAVDATGDWASGPFLTLAPGVANTIVIGVTGGLTLDSAVLCEWRNRYK